MSESLSESDDSITKFERNLRELMLDLHRVTELNIMEQHKRTCRSERSKKPSSHFNEDASYIAKSPKFAKKKLS